MELVLGTWQWERRLDPDSWAVTDFYAQEAPTWFEMWIWIVDNLTIRHRWVKRRAITDKRDVIVPAQAPPRVRKLRPLWAACWPPAADPWRRPGRCRTWWGSPVCWTECLPGRIPAWRGWNPGRTPPSRSRRSTAPTWPRLRRVWWCHLWGGAGFVLHLCLLLFI